MYLIGNEINQYLFFRKTKIAIWQPILVNNTIFKKKGARDDVDNYRGVTLLSCLGKLFTSSINARLTNYIVQTCIMGEEQGDFREGYSTMDHIFVLHTLIELYLSQKKRMYCCFIDYHEAFDTINRNALWNKIIQKTSGCKFL